MRLLVSLQNSDAWAVSCRLMFTRELGCAIAADYFPYAAHGRGLAHMPKLYDFS